VRFLEWDRDDHDPITTAIASQFHEGKPVIIPTDTLYGLAAPISNPDIILKIFQMKKRRLEMTLPIAVGSISSLEIVSSPDIDMIRFMEDRLPGPFTFILPASSGLPETVTRDDTVAIRIPDHPIFSILESRTGPLALTSANVHGETPVSSMEDAELQFGSEDLLMVVDGIRVSGFPSEIMDLTGSEPMVLRERRLYDNQARDPNGRRRAR
jgi:tRNA threonylcarbamoyl adenosine modification protein (Sua5/YciO/YrdC/YwlC family)